MFMRLRSFLLSFKSKLTLLVIAAILLPLLTASVILGNILRSRIHQSFENELQVGLGSIALILDRMEEDLAHEITEIADDKSLEENLGPETTIELKKTLKSHRKVLDISFLAVFDLNHQRIASSKFKSKNLDVDLTMAGRFQVARNEEEYYLLYVATVQKKHRPLGYVAGGIHLNDEDFLTYLREKHILNSAFWINGELILTDLPAQEITSTPAYETGKMIDFHLTGQDYKGMIQARNLGDQKLAYALLIPLAGLQEALVKMVIAVAIIVSLLFVIFLTVLGFIIGKITRPLNRLTDYARQLSSNNFTPQVDAGLEGLALTSRDEVGKLAESFTHMERQLRIYLQNLTETTRANEKIQSELRIAHDIQMSMLPRQMPVFSNGRQLEIAAVIEPAQEVGGDFYDYFMIDAHNLCVVIGDVSDKGVPASLFMAMSKTLLRAVTTLTRTMAVAGIAPEEVLTRVNLELCRDNELLMFVTIFYGVLNTENGEIKYSIGGHHPPYLLSPEKGIVALEHLRASPLGVKKDAHFESACLTLHPGEGLFLYTDGITEAMDAAGNLYSHARLEEFLRHLEKTSAGEMTKQTLGEVKRFAGGAPQNDDMTVLVLKYL
jgi:sigma-B regulation protein RsbU (phosphoserine phosphatase)